VKDKKPKLAPITHDAFFRKSFGTIEVARDYLQTLLSKDVLESIDLDALQRLETTYIDQQYQHQHSDLVFSAPLKGSKRNAILAFLLEHKSKQPKYIHVQLLSYQVRVWNENIKNKEPLSIVVPIVVYHGTKPWRHQSMKDYFPDIPESLHAVIPTFQFLLTDLASTSASELEQYETRNFLRNYLSALKFAKAKEFTMDVFRFVTFAPAFSAESELVIDEILLYVFSVIDATKRNEIELFVKQEKLQDMSTLYQVLKAEGKAEGKVEGFKVTITNLLLEFPHFTDAKIAQLVGCDVQLVFEIRKKTL
jgi:predicted transposase/invertase (TIGR01784 family)